MGAPKHNCIHTACFASWRYGAGAPQRGFWQRAPHIHTALPDVLILICSIRCYPIWVGCPQLCAMLVQHVRALEQARQVTSPGKINVTCKSPVGDISVVTLIRTDTTLDHSQKAEKVCHAVNAKCKNL